MRLHQVLPDYVGRVKLRVRPFPLELVGVEGVPRGLLEQEWWIAAIQEPAATFAPYAGDDYPTTTLPAFDAVWAAAQQSEHAALAFDLAVRRAFFAGSRNIGRREVLLDIAREIGLDVAALAQHLDGGKARDAVVAEAREGREKYHVRGTPTLTLTDGTRLRLPIAFPVIKEGRVVGVGKLPCSGADCLAATRALFEQALKTPPAT